MKDGGTRPQDAVAVLVIAAVVVCRLIARSASSWLRTLTGSISGVLTNPLIVAVAVLLVVAVVVLGVLRALVTRRLLADRVALALLPSESFDPTPEAVVAFAAGLSRVRRARLGWLAPRACAVRVSLQSLPGGRMLYVLEAPRSALGGPRSPCTTALSCATPAASTSRAWTSPPGGVPRTRRIALPSSTPTGQGRAARVPEARAELVLARRASLPLADRGVRPDPLAPVAKVFQSLRDDLDDGAVVCVDVLPATPGQAQRLRRRLLKESRVHGRAEPAAHPSLGELLRGERPGRSRRADAVELLERRGETAGLKLKLGEQAPLLRVQVLLTAHSRVKGRPQTLLGALLSAFDGFAGENHWRVRGVGVPGVAFLGADAPARRSRFDRRLRTGLFRAPRRNLVSAGEIAGLLKPPSVHCPVPNVVRLSEMVAPAPPTLPTFSAGRPDLVPLGRVAGEAGERVVALRLADTFFSYTAGRSRYGKTEMAIGQFVHLARSGHGGLFLDPHEDAIARIKSYLTDEGLRERVVEINLAGPAARKRQPGWNLFSMQGLGPEHAEGRVEAVVDAFASALRWDERNNRALTLTTQAAQALVELALVLPDELAPTLFQIPALLANDDWRTAVLSHVAPATRQFFTNRFPRLPADAITPVTNLIDRLRASTPVAALLGSSRSSYRIRQAMDEAR